MLTEPQTKRLEQVQFQINGTSVFSPVMASPVVLTGGGFSASTRPAATNLLTQLTLTPAQVVKIDAVLTEAAKKRQGLRLPAGLRFGGGLIDGGKQTEEQKTARLVYQRESAGIETKALADIQATFDVGQKGVWAERTGEVLDVSTVQTNNPFGGFGGFARGAGGPGGRTISIVTSLAREATRRTARGEYAAALAAYDEAIRLDPANTIYPQQKAQLLATCPSEWVRDGKQAVALMRKLLDQPKEELRPTYAMYDVLAAAHAEAGQFTEAVKAQEQAIAALPKDQPADGGGRVRPVPVGHAEAAVRGAAEAVPGEEAVPDRAAAAGRRTT